MGKPVKKTGNRFAEIKKGQSMTDKSGSSNALAQKKSFVRKYGWACLVLLFLSVILYAQTIRFDYTLDDKIVVVDNQFVKQGISGISKIFSTESFQGYFGEQKNLVAGSRYRPLSIATFAVEHELFGQNPLISHSFNILLYIITCFIILWVMDLMIPLRDSQNWYWCIPFICAVLYCVHPVHSEVVANIKGRDEIMALTGSLLALGCSFKFAKSNQRKWLIFAGISYFLGLLAKENAITFLVVIPVALWFFQNKYRRVITPVVLTLISLTLVYLLLRYQVIGFLLDSGAKVTSLMNDPFIEMDSLQRSATIMYTLGLYIKLLFFPHPLTHDYYPYHIPIMDWGNIWVLLSLALYAGLCFWVFKNWKKKSILVFSIIYFLATLSIVSNFLFSVGTFMNERFIYMSSLGFTLWAASFFTGTKWLNKGPSIGRIPLLPLILLAITLTGYGWKTFTRVPAWKNDLSLNQAAIKVSKNSARANVFMSTQLFNQYREESDQSRKLQLLDEAAPLINRALEIYPKYNDALTMKLGIAAEYFRMNREIDPLIQSFKEVAQIVPGHPYMFEYMEYLRSTGQYRKEMEDFFYSTGYNHYTLSEKKPEIGAKYLEKGLEMIPDSKPLLNALAQIYQNAGNIEKSQFYANKAKAL